MIWSLVNFSVVPVISGTALISLKSPPRGSLWVYPGISMHIYPWHVLSGRPNSFHDTTYTTQRVPLTRTSTPYSHDPIHTCWRTTLGSFIRRYLVRCVGPFGFKVLKDLVTNCLWIIPPLSPGLYLACFISCIHFFCGHRIRQSRQNKIILGIIILLFCLTTVHYVGPCIIPLSFQRELTRITLLGIYTTATSWRLLWNASSQ